MKIVSLLIMCLLWGVSSFAAADAVRVEGDLKVGGIHFSKDGSVMNSANDLLKNKGAWAAGTSYSAGDVVQAQSGSYVCQIANTNIVPPNATYWSLIGGAVGPAGPVGPANKLSIGTVVNGTQATATITGTAPNQTLNLVLPQGPKGDAGPTGPIGGSIGWTAVNGSTQQAVSNAGYFANNTSEVSITLPSSPSIGDIIKVTGIGIGGWKVMYNSGQSVITKNIVYTNSFSVVQPLLSTIPVGSAIIASIASSYDGSKLVAVPGSGRGGSSASTCPPDTVCPPSPPPPSGQIYISSNSGNSWVPYGPNQNWSSVASSYDGSKLVATVKGGQIYISSNSGVNWTPCGPSLPWVSVASSSDGSTLVAVAAATYSDGISSGNQIYTSSDSGVNWTPGGPALDWMSVASSSDGSKLVAGTSSGSIYTSTDSGTSWTLRGQIAPITGYVDSLVSSSDGSKIVAIGGGKIYISTDSGNTWKVSGPLTSTQYLYDVTSSIDGSRIVAANNNIYISLDSGANWNLAGTGISLAKFILSPDGNYLVMAKFTGEIYGTRFLSPTSISGGQYDAVELQYIGNNNYIIINYKGNLIVK